jgi:hypothetical protein
MLGAVEDGIWIGTAKQIGFIKGKQIDDYDYEPISDKPCPDGCFIRTQETEEEEIKDVVAWTSQEGFCEGRDSGAYSNKSHGECTLPDGEFGTMIERYLNGIRQYVAVIHKPDSPRKHTDATLTINEVTI